MCLKQLDSHHQEMDLELKVSNISKLSVITTNM